jgi:hypothetical protein
LPADVTAKATPRGDDPGYGVDLVFRPGHVIKASVWDDDGDNFFELRKGDAYCKISVGSNGLGPALQIEVFQQHGLVCTFKATGGPKDYAVYFIADLYTDGVANCDSDEADSSSSKHPCAPAWVAPTKLQAAPASWALWTARFQLPAHVVAKKTQRGDDPGYGVDLAFRPGHVVKASVWDDDGDNFLELRKGDAYCKISVGSNGLGPALQIEVFQQHGLVCTFKPTGGPKDYAVTVIAERDTEAVANCQSDEADRSTSKHPCAPAWVAPTKLQAAHEPNVIMV